MANREELMAAATVAVLLGVPIIGLVSLLSPVPTTCLDPPAVEGVKFHAVVPSTFYAYSPYFNDTSEGIVNPTGTLATFKCAKVAGMEERPPVMCRRGGEEAGWEECGETFSLECAANSSWLPLGVEVACLPGV